MYSISPTLGITNKQQHLMKQQYTQEMYVALLAYVLVICQNATVPPVYKTT
jgi:hypothetical protein